MTGRELIIYILANGLEDEPVYKDGKFIGYVSYEEAASKLDVGFAALGTLIRLHEIEHIRIHGETYLPFYYENLLKELSNNG